MPTEPSTRSNMDTSNLIKNIIEGFEDDFNMIVGEFSDKFPDLKLEDFFKYWQDSHMDCLFANRFDPRELLESISEMNKYLIGELTTESLETVDEKRRLIAFYFIFCLFVKQPDNSLQRKIRLTFSDVSCIKELISNKTGSSINKTGARFIWNKLISMNAIDFVEERLIYGPSMLICKNVRRLGSEMETSKADDLLISNRNEALQFIENKLDPNLVEVVNVSTPYEQMKDALRLEEYMDSTIEFKTNGTIWQFVDQVRSLLYQSRADSHQRQDS